MQIVTELFLELTFDTTVMSTMGVCLRRVHSDKLGNPTLTLIIVP